MNRINQISCFKNFFIYLFTCLLLTACGGESSGLPTQGIDPSKQVVSISISPSTVSLKVGETQAVTVEVTYKDGSVKDISSDIQWNLSDTGIATVSDEGVVQGETLGQAILTATFNGVTSGGILVDINDGNEVKEVTSLVVTPNQVTINEGETAQFNAIATFVDGTTRDVTGELTWTSTDQTVAAVDANGLLTGTGAGQATISGSFNGADSNDVAVTIESGEPPEKVVTSLQLSPGVVSIANGTQAQYSLIAIYEDGTSEDVTSLATWTSTNTSVATVNSDGIATGLSVGATTVKGTYLGVDSNDSALTINAAAINSIQVSPGAVTAANGTTRQFVATGAFSDGSTQDLSSQVTWTSSNPSVASIDGNGAASATQVGSTTISAALAGTTSNGAALTVTNATLSLLQISPASNSIAKGVVQSYTATAVFSDGSNQDVTQLVNWQSSNTNAATININGDALGRNLGTTTITANYLGSNSNQATLEVTSATILSIQVSPGALTIASGTSSNFTANAVLSDGSNVDISNQVTWITSNPTVATIGATGLAQGNSVGTAIITARQQGVVSNSATLTVSAATVTALQITPGVANIANGTTQAFVATAIFSDGTSQNVSNLVTWLSSDTNTATINAAGVATADGVGNTIITGQYLGQTSNGAALGVTAATVTSIAVTPDTASIAKGTTQAFIATATLSDGTVQNVSNLATWISSDANVASINASGVANADNLGNTNITAQYQGATSNGAAVTVTAATVASIVITPDTASIAKGTTQAFVATATFSDGSVQNVSSLVSWSSSDANVTTLDNTGLAMGNNIGSANVTAQYLGATSNAVNLTVTAATVTTVDITPDTASIAKGLSQAFVATATFSDGTTQIVTNETTWQSSNENVATINAAGIATGDNLGNTNITGTYQGVPSADIPLTVTAKVITDLKIQSTVAGSTQIQLIGLLGSSGVTSALAIYSDGSEETLDNADVVYLNGDSGEIPIDVLGVLSLDLGVATNQVITVRTRNAPIIASSNSLGINCLLSASDEGQPVGDLVTDVTDLLGGLLGGLLGLGGGGSDILSVCTYALTDN